TAPRIWAEDGARSALTLHKKCAALFDADAVRYSSADDKPAPVEGLGHADQGTGPRYCRGLRADRAASRSYRGRAVQADRDDRSALYRAARPGTADPARRPGGNDRAPAGPGLDQAEPAGLAAGARGSLLRLWRARRRQSATGGHSDPDR